MDGLVVQEQQGLGPDVARGVPSLLLQLPHRPSVVGVDPAIQHVRDLVGLPMHQVENGHQGDMAEHQLQVLLDPKYLHQVVFPMPLELPLVDQAVHVLTSGHVKVVAMDASELERAEEGQHGQQKTQPMVEEVVEVVVQRRRHQALISFQQQLKPQRRHL